ncbi:hypothetical protein LOTGIDRAFT_171775 [Lottia gigantea]|uniref:Uncharacterized protein n=1 Tax=Lottia gigantea TaxID=225164 RepID=V4CKD1_LOTGI|nr:hypothetical protein LOTGIDRAFT_171775 [Lottia gigantea]ESP02700.1 hypothetical protein LOTGIDRAFT_171775 [Lottia gigantea]
MIGWIKKRCNRRRSDSFGGKLKECGKGIKEVESDRPLYFALENKVGTCVEENNHYEEVEITCPLCRRTGPSGPYSCLEGSTARGCSEALCVLPIPSCVNLTIKLERRYSGASGYCQRPLPEIPGNGNEEASSSEDECYGYESMGSDSGISSDGGSDCQVYNQYESVLGGHDSRYIQQAISDDSDYEEIDNLPKFYQNPTV